MIPEQQTQALKPWHLKYQLISHQGIQLIRATNRRDSTYRDLDISGAYAAAQTENPKTLEKAKNFIREIGFKFPLPIGAKTALEILNGTRFPELKAWEDFFSARTQAAHGYTYSEEDYKSDKRLFTECQLKLKDFKELFSWLIKAAKSTQTNQGTLGFLSEQNKLAYAASIQRLSRKAWMH